MNKPRPIIFSSGMIRALLAGRKSQTRRILKPQPERNVAGLWVWPPYDTKVTKRTWRGACQSDESGLKTWFSGENKAMEALPAMLGQLLWVREAFITGWPLVDDEPDQFNGDGRENPLTIWYRATADINVWVGEDGYHGPVPWRSPIHMPRWASRLTLEVTEVRLQRLQEMEGQHPSESDAIAEGVNAIHHGDGAYYYSAFRNEPHPKNWCDPTDAFRELWTSLHGPGAWAKNPWCCAISFQAHHKNIDALLAERKAA